MDSPEYLNLKMTTSQLLLDNESLTDEIQVGTGQGTGLRLYKRMFFP
jgi:hypothetical protein